MCDVTWTYVTTVTKHRQARRTAEHTGIALLLERITLTCVAREYNYFEKRTKSESTKRGIARDSVICLVVWSSASVTEMRTTLSRSGVTGLTSRSPRKLSLKQHVKNLHGATLTSFCLQYLSPLRWEYTMLWQCNVCERGHRRAAHRV